MRCVVAELAIIISYPISMNGTFVLVCTSGRGFSLLTLKKLNPLCYLFADNRDLASQPES